MIDDKKKIFQSKRTLKVHNLQRIDIDNEIVILLMGNHISSLI